MARRRTASAPSCFGLARGAGAGPSSGRGWGRVRR